MFNDRASRTLPGTEARKQRINEIKRKAARFRTLREFRKMCYNDFHSLVREGIYDNLKKYYRDHVQQLNSKDKDDVLDFIINDLYNSDFNSVEEYKFYRPEFYNYLEEIGMSESLQNHIDALRLDKLEEKNNNVRQ